MITLEGIEDLVDVIPVVTTASGAVTAAIDKATVAITTLPKTLVNEAKTGVEEISYVAGRGFGRGLAWNILPPILLGTGAILIGLLLYKSASARIPAYAQ